ncbi:RNA polymerase subunit sigma-70 [Tenggerimyces flavus]|uniref:RNA polymerase subunit sigma-70 n=1 Tax=Tenggerimyces flavus TaxID=1708749 RepID=A0ABV7Y8U5_9ACTN|nr:RNA polymerase subunit sigma-70 [Tenggerimyces flavus]MBM7785608.1 RNA polymerase sigma-70 factor (ECF subfamily) [Tenggerimyces flavus]
MSIAEEEQVVLAARDGDERAFGELAERYRPELRVLCYRMLGSLDEAEDLVQDTYLRAWRARDTFRLEGRWSFRAWLYRIATNACLNALSRSPLRKVLPAQLGAAGDPSEPVAPPVELPWLQPFPDDLLAASDPEEIVVAKESIELAYLAAIQHLPPRQRAALILREVVGWSAKDVAALLETTDAAVASALQRARATMPSRSASRPSTAEEREVLRRYMDAHERADISALAALLREDAIAEMPPIPTWFDGREAILTATARGFQTIGPVRFIATHANGRPAAACFANGRPFSLDLLRIERGQIAEITSFGPDTFRFFEELT